MRRLLAALALLLTFLWDLVASSLTVARIVLSPRPRTRPAIVAMPTDLRRDWTVTMLAYLTSLTPGSTCLHVSTDGRILYLHLLDAVDVDASVARFRRLYERRLLVLEGR